MNRSDSELSLVHSPWCQGECSSSRCKPLGHNFGISALFATGACQLRSTIRKLLTSLYPSARFSWKVKQSHAWSILLWILSLFVWEGGRMMINWWYTAKANCRPEMESLRRYYPGDHCSSGRPAGVSNVGGGREQSEDRVGPFLPSGRGWGVRWKVDS